MKKTRKLEFFVCICTLGLLFILLVSHTYNDIVITTRHGINFWNILLDGKFLDFYNLNILASGNRYYTVTQGCAYNILVYIVFAIWNFPLYLLERFASVDVMNSIPCLVYSKLLVVACMIITAYILKDILKALKVPEEHHNLMLYLYVSSTLMVTVIFITGQYDILSLIFQLLGLLAFIKGKDKAFVFWFGIAFCLKYFAAIIFLPLLLLRHKKVISWIKNLVMLLMPLVITKAPFLLHSIFNNGTNTSIGGEAMAANILIDMLVTSNVNSAVNLFVIIYVTVLVWCYLQDDALEGIGYCGVWVSMVAYAAFFGLMNAYPYWSILLAPFVTLAIAMTPVHFCLNVILETLGYAGLVGVNMIRYYWVYFGDTMKPMIWSRILGEQALSYDGSFLHYVIMGSFWYFEIQPIVKSVFVAALVALVYTTYPVRNYSSGKNLLIFRDCYDILLLRFAVNSIICLLPILALFI